MKSNINALATSLIAAKTATAVNQKPIPFVQHYSGKSYAETFAPLSLGDPGQERWSSPPNCWFCMVTWANSILGQRLNDFANDLNVRAFVIA